MPTVFGKEERGFYNAFSVLDPLKRRGAFNKWIRLTTPIIQAAVSQELEDLVSFITENRWTDEGWKRGKIHMQQIENEYHLIMEIKLRKVYQDEKYRGKLPEPVFRPAIRSDVNLRESIPGAIMTETQIDLHGMKVTEARLYVDDFLKDCHKTNTRMVWVIHGKGTGVLKEEIRKFLANHPLVESLSTADPSHGGEGAVQVTLKSKN
jgi:DNA-nicking Smr family endonuclease